MLFWFIYQRPTLPPYNPQARAYSPPPPRPDRRWIRREVNMSHLFSAWRQAPREDTTMHQGADMATSDPPSSRENSGEEVERRPTTPPPAYVADRGGDVEALPLPAYSTLATPEHEDSRRGSFDEIPASIPSPSSSFALPPPAYTLPPAPYPLSVADYARASEWNPSSIAAQTGFVGDAGGEGDEEAARASTPVYAAGHSSGPEEGARDVGSVASASRGGQPRHFTQERPPVYSVQQPRRPLPPPGRNRTTTTPASLEAGALEIGSMAQGTGGSGNAAVVRRRRRRCHCSKTAGAFLLITLVIVVTVVAVRIARGHGW